MRNSLRWMVTAVLLSGLAGVALGQAAGSGEPNALDADPHLVGWWKFDEASGTTAADSSKADHPGTLQGGFAFDGASVPGRRGKALLFDGKADAVEIVGYKGIGSTAPRTVAAWIKTKGNAGGIVVWGADDFGKMWTLGSIRGRIGVTPGGGYLYMKDLTNDDQWHHVVAVIEKAESPNLHDDVNLYLDGEPATIHDIGLLDLWPIDTGSDLDVRIGAKFNGAIDDVRIYDRPLSKEEVKALYQQK